MDEDVWGCPTNDITCNVPEICNKTFKQKTLQLNNDETCRNMFE